MRRKIIITIGIISLMLIVTVAVFINSEDKKQPEVSDKNDVANNEPTQKLTAIEALETVMGNNSVANAKYFANNTWLVGVTSSAATGDGETYTIVSKLSGGRWSTVEVGTFIDTEQLLLEGAPPDVITYLEEIQ